MSKVAKRMWGHIPAVKRLRQMGTVIKQSRQNLYKSIHSIPKRKVQLIPNIRQYGPSLSIILVGSNPASESYIRKKMNYAKKANITAQKILIPTENVSPELVHQSLQNQIKKLNQNEIINGIILQLPINAKLPFKQNYYLNMISPIKDVDCLTQTNINRFYQKSNQYNINQEYVPCSVQATIRMIQNYKISLKNKKILIIGKGKLVGEPLYTYFNKYQDLKSLQSSIQIVDKNTDIKEIKQMTKNSDIIFSATGQKDILTKEDFKKGCIVFDIGVIRDSDNPKKVRGDFSEEIKKQVCSYYTPVPYGFGPMVVSSLMNNVKKAYEKQRIMPLKQKN